MSSRPDLDARMRRLEDARAIRELKARYFRHMDLREWSALRDVFTADAVMDMRGASDELKASGVNADPETLVIAKRDTIVSTMEGSLFGIATVHHGHMPEITFVSDDEAKGIWPMEDTLIFPKGAQVRRLHGFGHYHETYRREQDGCWRISHLRFTRLHVEIE